jgi:hypothetical protein
MWRRVDLVWTDISEEHIDSKIGVEKPEKEEPAWAACSHLLKLVPRSWIFLPEDGVDTYLRNVGSHNGATSQKTAFFIIKMNFFPLWRYQISSEK